MAAIEPRHSRECGNPWTLNHWIPAFAGMTGYNVVANIPDCCVNTQNLVQNRTAGEEILFMRQADVGVRKAGRYLKRCANMGRQVPLCTRKLQAPAKLAER